MDYHQDRFDDFSLLIFKKEKLIAVFPANKRDEILYSHQGLSYGGLVFKKNSRFAQELESFKALLNYIKLKGFITLNIKLIPKIYNSYPSDAIDYLLFLLNAKLYRRDVSSAIFNAEKLNIQSNRLQGKKKGEKQGLVIKEEIGFDKFWNNVLIPNLERKHQVIPVHSLEEISLLKERFPNNIRQFNVYHKNSVVAGATIFETKQVAHVQYISGNQDNQKLGSLDFLFEYLITNVFKNKMYFNFGISNENNGQNINQGLLFWKEGFGARAITQDFYKIDIKNVNKLDSIFI